MKSFPQKLLAPIVGVFALVACGILPEQLRGTPTPFFVPTSFPTPVVTVTPNPFSPGVTTAVPQRLPSPTPTVTPIDEELLFEHPLSIEHLRGGEYPGSAITFEAALEPGSNYGRFYVSYLSEDLVIYALMTIPNGEPPSDGWPVIIFNHGYIPPTIYQTTERYEGYVDALARNGYIVFRSDYRGHDRSQGEARGAYGYPDYTIDVMNAVVSMKDYPEADPDRIGMWGHSMGGFITLRCMVISDDIRAGVIWAGVVAPYMDMVYKWPDQEYEIPESANSWRTTLAAEYGTPAQNPVFWDTISANTYLNDISGPVQLHHGTGDLEVPLGFSSTLYQQLLTADIPAELYLYENDNHNISISFDVAMRRTIQYFDRYLRADLE